MTKIQKDTTVTLQVTAEGQRTQKPGFVFYSHDSETALINVKINTLGDNVELSEDDTVRIFMRVKQKGQYKHLVYKMMKSEQKSQYQLYIPDELLGYEGRVECGVYIDFSAGETLDVGYFDFQMRKSMIDGEFKELDTIYVKEFSETLEKIKLMAEEYEYIKLIAEEYEDKYSTAIEENQEEFNLFFNEAKYNMQALLESEGLVTAQVLKDSISAVPYVGTNLWAPWYYAKNKGYITSSGTIVDDPNLIYSDYIAVGDNTSLIRTTLAVSGLPHTSVSYYDADQKFISIIQEGVAEIGSKLYNFPSKTAYVRFNCVNPKTHGGKHKLEFGDKATDYSINPYDIETMFADVKKAVLELSDKVLGGK